MDSDGKKYYTWISLTKANDSLLTDESHEFLDRHKGLVEMPPMETPKYTRTPPIYAGFPIPKRENLPPIATSTPRGKFPEENPEDVSFVSSISNFSAIFHVEESKKHIQKTSDAIRRCQREILNSEAAILEARRRGKVIGQLAAQRRLLVEKQRLKLLEDELGRLKALAAVRNTPPKIRKEFRSSLTVSDIQLQLNKNFRSASSFAFLVTLRCRTEIDATSVMTWHPRHYETLGKLEKVVKFHEKMSFSNLPVDFVIGMDVFMMKVPERPAKKSIIDRIRSIFGKFGSRHEKQPDDMEFQKCGRLELNSSIRNSGNCQFLLDDVIYPLEGTVRVSVRRSALPAPIKIENRGFLSIFQNDGNATWQTYWAVLARGKVHFWRCQNDEKAEKPPLFQIDLTKCTNQSIESQKNENFKIELLIDESPNLLEKRRVLLAAENAEILEIWLNSINETLWVLRGPK